jgi:hypothetical protein
MTAAFTSLERWSRVTPLGVRFVDDQNGKVVAEGLRVSAWPTAEPSRVRSVPLNGTNVFYLMDVAGLRDLEFGAGDDAYWAGLARRLGFTLEVEDLQGRFLPFRFTADLPPRGLMRLACGSPATPVALPSGAEPDGVPLFTAPARAATPGTVVLRADLWDAANHVAAAWAVVEARTPGARLRGEPPLRAIADDRGCVALHLPVPDERDFDGGSFDSPTGGGGAGAPLAARTWIVEIDASYGRLPAAPATASRAARPIPDLCAALAQPPAHLWDQLGPAPRALTQVTLRYGQETLLKSSDVGQEPTSVLLLTPSQSPP